MNRGKEKRITHLAINYPAQQTVSLPLSVFSVDWRLKVFFFFGWGDFLVVFWNLIIFKTLLSAVCDIPDDDDDE